MGKVVNPKSIRLSINKYWNSTWSNINNFNYLYISKLTRNIERYFDYFIRKNSFVKAGIAINHFKIYIINQAIFINIYYYSSYFQQKKSYFQNSKILSKIRKNSKKKININKNFKSLYDFIIKLVITNLYYSLTLDSNTKILNKINSFSNYTYVYNIYNLDNINLNSYAISNYIALQLKNKYSLDWVLKPVIRDLNSKMKYKIIKGYKITCSGRFTRRQIATYKWMKQGKLQFNTFSNVIKYNSVKVRLKYGICGIKVWLNYGFNDYKTVSRRLKLTYPSILNFNFKYSNNILTLYLSSWLYSYIRVDNFKNKSYNSYKKYLKYRLRKLIYYTFKPKNCLNYNIRFLGNNKIIIYLKKQKKILNYYE